MAPERPDYDQTLKRLLTEAHDGVLAFLLPGARWLGEVSPELHASQRQADLVWDVALPSGQVALLHIELQTNPDPLMGERMADYALRLWLEHHRPVHSIVVYLRETAAQLPDTFVLPRGDGEPTLHGRFDVVRLWSVPADVVLTRPEPALWPLAALMAGNIVQTVTEVAERLEQAGLPRREHGELAGVLAVLARARLPRDVVMQVMGRHPMLRELVGEDALEELFADLGYAERAEARGEASGEARGRVAAMRELVQALVERRFGTLTADELTALQGADVTLLQEIGTHLLDDTREQIRARLGLSARR